MKIEHSSTPSNNNGGECLDPYSNGMKIEQQFEEE